MEEVNVVEAFEIYKPENCVFVISVDSNAKPNGMIAGWNMKCSMDPPLMAVSLSKTGCTHKLIRESKEFVIAVPNKAMEKDLRFFGSNHGDKVDKFKETGIETEKAKSLKSPLLKNATVNFECRLQQEIDAGDHFIYIGKVVAAHTNKDKKVLLSMRKVGGERVFEEF